MSKNKGILSEKEKDKVIKEIIGYFATEKDEEIGVIAAQDILDFLLDQVEKNIYNKGVDDATKYFRDRLEGSLLDTEINVKK